MKNKKSSLPMAMEPKPCPKCHGRGWVDNRCLTPDHAHYCPHCAGKGFDAGGKNCYACHGTGLIEVRQTDKNPCPQCSGAGVYPVPPTLTAWDFAFKPGTKA